MVPWKEVLLQNEERTMRHWKGEVRTVRSVYGATVVPKKKCRPCVSLVQVYSTVLVVHTSEVEVLVRVLKYS